MTQMKAKGVPLTATVKHDNQSGMANRLLTIGFAQTKLDDTQTKCRFS
jgi:hypothetical protein